MRTTWSWSFFVLLTRTLLRATQSFISEKPMAGALLVVVGVPIVTIVVVGIVGIPLVTSGLVDLTATITSGLVGFGILITVLGIAFLLIGVVGAVSRGVDRSKVRVLTAMKRHRAKIAVGAFALGFAWFIWPTPYRTFGQAGVMQVNRFTGAKCAVGESCWRSSEDSKSNGDGVLDRLYEDLLRRPGKPSKRQE